MRPDWTGFGYGGNRLLSMPMASGRASTILLLWMQYSQSGMVYRHGNSKSTRHNSIFGIDTGVLAGSDGVSGPKSITSETVRMWLLIKEAEFWPFPFFVNKFAEIVIKKQINSSTPTNTRLGDIYIIIISNDCIVHTFFRQIGILRLASTGINFTIQQVR